MSNTPIDRLKMPAGLTREQRAEFRRLTRAMGAAGFIECDAAAVAGYLDAWALVREASANLRESGATIRTPNGSLQVSPWHSIQKAQTLLLIRWVRELGISPSGRKRLGVDVVTDDPEEVDLWGESGPAPAPAPLAPPPPQSPAPAEKAPQEPRTEVLAPVEPPPPRRVREPLPDTAPAPPPAPKPYWRRRRDGEIP